MNSIWSYTARIRSFPALESKLETTAAVIGGGMAGVLTAYAFKRAGISAVLLEANTLASGQTGCTTAKLTVQHGLSYARMLRKLGQEAAGQYVRANQRGAEWVRSLPAACDLRECTSYLYATGDAVPLEQELEAGRRLGLDMFLTQNTELPFSATALGLKNQAVFHPLKLMAALAEDLTVYEHTRVLGVENGTIRTEHGVVRAEWVVFTCHFPFVNFPGYYFARQHQERSYVLALEGAPALRDAYLGIEEDGFSLRSWDKYLLLGGSGHRTGENAVGGQYEALRQASRHLFPGCREAMAWSAQDCMPYDCVPYIGQFSPARPRWLVATGFQKWGMTSSAAAARILTDIITGENPKDAAVFAPHRFHISFAGSALRDMGKAASSLTRSFLFPGRAFAESLPTGHGGIVTLKGKKVGAYRDEDGTLYVISPRCPHLGCQLEWNPEEKTWDCPCHGSRFTFRGAQICGPAQQNARDSRRIR